MTPTTSPGSRHRAASRDLGRLVRFLVAATAIEVALSAVLRVRALGSDSGIVRLAAVFGIGWLPVLAVALGLEVQHVRRLSSVADAATQQLSSAAVTTRDWFWRVDSTGVLTFSSDTSRDVLGRAPDDLVGRSIFDVIAPVDVLAARVRFDRAVESATGWQDLLVRVVSSDGRTWTVEHSGVPAFDAAGRLVGFGGTCRTPPPERLAERSRQRSRGIVADIIDLGRFRPAFQPIVSLLDGRVVGVEALMRFDPAPYQPPDLWFARAYSAGLGLELEKAAVQRVLRVIGSIPPDLYVSINASPRFVASEEFLPLLSAPEVPLGRLVIELTEHESIDDYPGLSEVLAPLRRRGLRVAVDDAGAGYASFHHIVQLRPDIIKLDRALVQDIDLDPARRALTSAVVLFSLELPATVTAEGVETAAQLDVLGLLGVDAAQGFHLARPTASPSVWRSWPGLRFATADSARPTGRDEVTVPATVVADRSA